MATIREQIVAKVQLKVNTGTPGGVPQTERARTFALAPDQLMSSVVYGKRDEVKEPEARRPASQTNVILHFELRAKATPTTSPDLLLDPVIDWIVKTLDVGDVIEPGLWEGIEYLDTDFEWAQADYAFCLATVRFRVLSQIKRGNPSALA